jgi:2-hydroxy-4-carboxymuconate semialdehyde hemiacetal dehydrogenase
MDMSIQLQTESGSILTLALSFNNDGPFGTTFRYICDNGTYVARFDDLVDGYDNAIDLSAVDVSLSGVELQDRDFIDAILTQREPRSSVGRVLDCYRTLDLVERQFGA